MPPQPPHNQALFALGDLEADLRRQRDELDDLYNHAPCGHHSLDADGVIQRINDTALGWLGYSREEIVGKRRITEFLTPKSVATFLADYPKFNASSKVDHLEFDLVGKDGSVRPVVLSGTAIRDEHGTLVASRSVLLEHPAAPAPDSASLPVPNVSPIAMCMIRGADNQITLASRTFSDVVGRSASDAIGLDFRQICVDPGQFDAIRDRLGQGDIVVDQAMELRAPGRPESPPARVLASFAALEHFGTKSMLAWFHQIGGHDESRHRLEEERDRLAAEARDLALGLAIANEAAEAAERLKTTILKNVNHELRTPLNGILGMLGLVRRRLVDPTLNEHLGKADASARLLLSILNGLIDLASTEADRLTVAHVPFNPADLVARLRGQFMPAAALKRLSLHIEDVTFGPQIARRLVGDPLRLHQILRELLENAIKFSDQGSIAVHSTVEANATGEVWLTCRVTDEGIGIPTEAQQRIFEPFTQLDGSNTRRHRGMGIGLALSRRLARRMDGCLEVVSVPGKGSTFTLSIPLDAESPDAREEKTHEVVSVLKQRHPRASVLIAEHDAAVRATLSGCLESAGLTVFEAQSDTDALELARVVKFDLVLLDVAIPRRGNDDVLAAFRAMPQYAATPILGVTTQSAEEMDQQLWNAGFSGLIALPCTPNRLLKTTFELLSWGQQSQAPY